MKAFFDKNCVLVGWYDESNQMVFSIDMQWIGFVKGEFFFLNNCNWIGGFKNMTFIDKNGKPVAWLQGGVPSGTMPLLRPMTPMRPLTPLRPLRPLTPLRPLKPLTPLGGWSQYTWQQYIATD